MARSRSAKDLAQRVERDYFKRWDPYRRALFWTSVASVLVSLVVIAFWLLPSQRLAWSRGSVRPAHGFVENDCGACHGDADDSPNPEPSLRRQADLVVLSNAHAAFGAVNEAKCSGCHEGAAHHSPGPTPPGCTSCHAEHGAPEAQSSKCTSCHADLTGAWPAATFRDVTGFPEGHPEFAALAQKDKTTLALNHDVHLWAGLQGPNGPEPLECASCHSADAADRGFLPVRYATHCARCHTLTLPEHPELDALPHGNVKEAVEFLEKRLETEAGTKESVTTLLGQFSEKVCQRCHQPGEPSPTEPLAIQPVAMSERFLPHARFRHRNHRELGCGACHQAEVSRRSEDVLLPGKTTCAQCHAPAKGAPAQCADCHGYHLPDSDPYGPARFTLPE